MAETTAITLRVPEAELTRIEAIASQCALQSLNASGHFARAFTMAAGIRMLRASITKEMMADIMQLQGTKLGFRTDKDKEGGYPEPIVKECAIEHMLRGGLLIGNEMNIIAGGPYQTKEFFTRKLAEFPGLTDLRLMPGVPVAANGGALVPYSATWVFQGKPDRIDRTLTKLPDGTQLDERICVRVNSGMGADAILGKAERKIKAAIYARLTGTVITDGDIDEGAPRRSVASLEDLTQHLEGSTQSSDANQGPHSEDVSQVNPLDGFAERLSDCQDLAAITVCENEFVSVCESDAQRAEVAGRCQERRDQIKASRAKGKQGQLAGA